MSVGTVSGSQAKRLAISVPVAVAVLSFVASISGNMPELSPGRVIAGTIILMVLLAMMAEAVPSIAAGFAWLILVTALFVTGEPAWLALSKATGNGSARKGGTVARVTAAGQGAGSAALNKTAEAVATTNK